MIIVRIFNVFKKSKHFDFDRYPEIFWVEGYSRKSSIKCEKKWNDTSPKNENSNIEYDPNYNIDILGCYIYNKDENYIELYGTRIKETSERISKRLGISYELTLELLQAIVLIHEIGHFQLKYFHEMIPTDFRAIWLDGLANNLFKLKN